VGPARWSAPDAHASPHLSREELESALRGAAVVVCHGGAGIISSALAAGRRPIVVPRRAALGEHVDDHQHQLTRKLADWGLVVAVEDRLSAADVQAAREPLRIPPELSERPTAAEVLRRALAG
jgi:UDP-N-acetylglucosamine transferase subunit ALG13